MVPKNINNMEQVIVVNKIKAALFSVLDSIETYPYCVFSDVPVKKLESIKEKFLKRYPDLLRSRNYAWKLRKKNLPSHRLVIFKPDGENDIEGFFVLMSSMPDNSGEKWQDARERNSRVVVYGYELVRHTRPGKASPAWSWRISAAQYRHYVELLKDAVAKRKDQWLEQFIQGTRRWPGFALVRQQHRELGRVYYWHWKRTRKGDPVVPWPRLTYVTRRAASRKKFQKDPFLVKCGHADTCNNEESAHAS